MTDDIRAPTATWESAGFILIRSPLLPFDQYARLARGESTRKETTSPETSNPLAELVDMAVVREAVALASGDLTSAIPQWKANPRTEHGRRIESALRRYVARMCFRPTPFGLFAGCTLGEVAHRTVMKVVSRSAYIRHSRIDSQAYQDGLRRIRDEDHADLMYAVNATLRIGAGRLTYSRPLAGMVQRALVAIEPDQAILAIVKRARDGATLADIGLCLHDDDVDDEEIAVFLKELIDDHVLEPKLKIPVILGTSRLPSDPAGRLEQPSKVGQAMRSTEEELAKIDATGVGVPLQSYDAVRAGMREVSTIDELGRLIQVDLWKPAVECSISDRIIAEGTRALHILHRLFRPKRTSMNRAVEAFQERFQAEEVNLEDALDDEIGIGFRWDDSDNAPLLPDDEERVERQLLAIYTEAISSAAPGIYLSDEQIERLEIRHSVPLPDAVALLGNLVATSAEAVERGDFDLVVKDVCGPSGAQYLGRFCHLDTKLLERTKALLVAEEACYPDAAFAEIVHELNGRGTNVVRRPQLRKYEIPVLGQGSGDPVHTLEPSDLRLSVVGGSFVLRSAKLNRQVIPRLSSAHRWQNLGNLPLYQFLAAFETQNATNRLGWSWGRISSAAWLPRVHVGRVVLARQRWLLKAKDFVQHRRESSAAGLSYFQDRWGRWKEKVKPPRWLVLAESDNRLPIHLDDDMSERWVYDAMRKHNQVLLEEMLPGPDALCLSGPEGRFTHELVVPLIKRASVRSATASTRAAEVHTCARAARRLGPGSDWVYGKLYMGRATADHVLRSHIAPFLARQEDVSVAANMFFVRYTDPRFHLRVRFRGERKQWLPDVLRSLLEFGQQLMDDGLIWKLQLDTYEREIERYGGDEGISPSEDIFCADSATVLRLMHELPLISAEQRLVIAMMGAHALFEDFGITGASYESLLTKLSAPSAKRRKQFSREFRDMRKPVEQAMSRTSAEDLVVSRAQVILRERSVAMQSAIEQLSASARDGILTRRLEDMASSHVHMFLNRWLQVDSDSEERVYDWLARHSRATLARAASPGVGELVNGQSTSD